MPRRPAQRRSSVPASAPAAGVNRCRALVRVDGGPIREELRREYLQARQKLDKARQDLKRFECDDLPAFTRWLHSNFGGLLTRIREAQSALADLEALILEIQCVVIGDDVSEGRAYGEVMRRRNAPPPTAGPDDEPPRSKQDRASRGNPRRGDGGVDDLEEFFREFEQTFEEDDEGFGAGRRGAAVPREARPDSPRLKELYRAIVRLLHPDTQKEMTPEKLERWHQAQEAYQRGDADELETILALCELERDGSSDVSPASVWQRLTGQYRKALREIQRTMKQHREHPAWNFSRLKDLRLFGARVRHDLELDLATIRSTLSEAEAAVAAWKAQSEGRRSRRRRRPPDVPF